MSVHAKCGCGYQRELPDFYAGKQVRCPKCSSILVLASANIYDIEPDQPSVAPALPTHVRKAYESERPVHPGAAAMGSIDVTTPEPLSPLSEQPPALPNPRAPIAPQVGTDSSDPFAQQMASADIFKERPRIGNSSMVLANINLLMGAVIALITRHPYIGMAFSGAWAFLALITAMRARSEGKCAIVPILFIAVLTFLGIKHYQVAKEAGLFSSTPKVSHDVGNELDTFVTNLVSIYGEQMVTENFSGCKDDYFASHPHAPAWMKDATYQYEISTSPLEIELSVTAKGVEAFGHYVFKHGEHDRSYSTIRKTKSQQPILYHANSPASELAHCYE